jgi:hypothetical protein
LSIVENPKPSRGSYGNWLGDKKPTTAHDNMRKLIDEKLIVGQDLGAFLVAMKRAGCEVKIGKHIALRLPGGKKFFRLDSLGENYTQAHITERLLGVRDVAPRKTSDTEAERQSAEYTATLNQSHKPNLLIDIQAKIKEGAGDGYVRWMTIFNLKAAARTLIFLQENKIDSYEDLINKSAAASSEFHSRVNKMKKIETEQKSIAELQKQIGTYHKTHENYKMYNSIKKPKDREQFYEANCADIMLCKAAKKYFDGLGLKKLPSINSLKQEWATLEAERKKLYVGYKDLKEKYTTLGTARANADHILNAPTTPQKSRTKTHDYGAR